MSPNLDPWELDEVRAEIADSLPDVCNLLSPTYIPDGMGGLAITYGITVANVPCRLDVIKPREQLSNDRNTHFTTFMMTLPYDTVVVANYRISFKGETYNVTGIAPDKSWAGDKRVTVERVTV